MTDHDDKAGPVDAADTALRRGLQTEPLSAEALRRIRAATQLEWRATTGKSIQPRYWKPHAGIAAALALVFVAALLALNGTPGRSSAVLGTLARADYPGAVEQRRWSADRSIANGEPLHAGQHIQVRGGARIDLPGAGSLRLAAGTDIEIVSAQLLRLVDGSIYLDFPPGQSAPLELGVQTPAGTFTHVGTQFQVALREGQTTLQVREGQVRWRSASGDVLSAAGTQLSIDRDGKATRTQVGVVGAGWSWTEGLAASFEIENRSLAEFLHYIARETGHTLVFANASAENRAATTTLHGSMNGLSPVEALSTVMATTSMRFTLAAGSIRIESGGDAGQATK